MAEHSTAFHVPTAKATAPLQFSPVTGKRGALVLAAGASQRMGTPKALLPWHGATLLEYVLRQVRTAAIGDIVVVLGPATRHLDGTLGDVRVVFNLAPETGRSASIRIGSAALPVDVESIVIQSVDQPCPADVLKTLLDAAALGAAIVVPTHHGRRGHPICVAGRLLPELRQVNEESEGLRAIVRAHAEQLVEVAVDSESVLWNLNDPAAYSLRSL